MITKDKLQVKALRKYEPLSKYKGLLGTLPIVGGYTYIGLEVELEHIPRSDYKNLSESTWRVCDDGSLKDSGKEFVTIPIKFKYLEMELNRLFSGLSKPLVSTRCSTHVHINVREMTTEELGVFILLYSIFERAFYRFSGDRWNSNFCIPLFASPYYPKRLLKHLFNEKISPREFEISWYKYLGFNVCPIIGSDGSGVQGTVEFRHMEGTTDPKYIINWINLIVSLKLASKRFNLETMKGILLTMNADSSYISLTQSIFGEFANLLLQQPTFKRDIESCITATKKLIFIQNDELAPKDNIEIPI